MAIVQGIWNTVRGISLLAVLAVLFTGVLMVSCLARLVLGSGFSEVAGRLNLGS